MAKAAILIGGYLKRLTNLTNYGFNIRSGYLSTFVFQGVKYVHVNKSEFKEQDTAVPNLISGGYYNEAEFLKYLVKVDYTANDISQFNLQLNKLEDGLNHDRIYVRKLNITAPYTNFCQVDDWNWEYIAGTKLIDDSPESNIIIPPKPISTVDEVTISVHPVASAFYDHKIQLLNGPNFPDAANKDAGAYLISKIALYIDKIHKDIFPLFASLGDFQSYINSQNLEWETIDIFINPTVNDLTVYLSSIANFYISLYSNQLLIINAKTENKLYWFAYVLSADALSVMPVQDKIKVLKIIAVGGISEVNRLNQLVRLNPVNRLVVEEQINEEKFLLKIVESIKKTPNQSDEFLDTLLFLYESG